MFDDPTIALQHQEEQEEEIDASHQKDNTLCDEEATSAEEEMTELIEDLSARIESWGGLAVRWVQASASAVATEWKRLEEECAVEEVDEEAVDVDVGNENSDNANFDTTDTPSTVAPPVASLTLSNSESTILSESESDAITDEMGIEEDEEPDEGTAALKIAQAALDPALVEPDSKLESDARSFSSSSSFVVASAPNSIGVRSVDSFVFVER